VLAEYLFRLSIRDTNNIHWDCQVALLADQSRELITFRDIEDVEIQKDLVTPDLQGPNMENFLTLHHLSVDHFRCLQEKDMSSFG